MRICRCKCCPYPQPMPDSSFDGRKRYCRECTERLAAEKPKKEKTWAYALLWGMQRDRAINLDPTITTITLEALMRLQEQQCGITRITFKLPTEQDLLELTYQKWVKTLPNDEAVAIPILVSAEFGNPIEIGYCTFIAHFIYPAYKYYGSISRVITAMQLKQPIYYQPVIVSKTISNIIRSKHVHKE